MEEILPKIQKESKLKNFIYLTVYRGINTFFLRTVFVRNISIQPTVSADDFSAIFNRCGGIFNLNLKKSILFDWSCIWLSMHSQ